MKNLIQLDTLLFLKIYNAVQKNKTLEKVAVIGTKMSYYIFFIIYILGISYVLFANIGFAPRFLIVPFLGVSINTLLRKIFKRKRPVQALNIKTSIEKDKANSFPSNHSAAAMVIVMAFMALNLPLGVCLVPLALLTGLSRVASGVHFPFDVLAGLTVGFLIGYVGFFIL